MPPFGAPVLLIALVGVEMSWARPVVHPRRYVMALGLLPGVFAAVVALAAVVASGYGDAGELSCGSCWSGEVSGD